MASLVLNEPNFVDGNEFIVIQDYLGMDSLNSSDQHHAFGIPCLDESPCPLFVLLNEIYEIRALYSTVPVYGVIQLAIYNGLIDFNHDLTLIVFDEKDPNTGLLIAKYVNDKEETVYKSALINNGFSASIQNIDLNNIERVLFDPNVISLPDKAIKTAEEISEIEKKDTQKVLLICCSAFLIVLMAGLGFSYYSAISKKNIVNEIERKRQELNLLVKKRSEIKATKLPEGLNNKTLLLKLSSLYFIDHSMVTVNDQGGRSAPITISNATNIKLISNQEVPNNYFDWLKSTLLPTGEWIIEIKK